MRVDFKDGKNEFSIRRFSKDFGFNFYTEKEVYFPGFGSGPLEKLQFEETSKENEYEVSYVSRHAKRAIKVSRKIQCK